MRIVQILKSLAYGDAIGNHVLALEKLFNDRKIENCIFAQVIDKRLPDDTAYDVRLYERKPGDVILYHFSTGTELNQRILEFGCPIVIYYHNVTPASFFEPYKKDMAKVCEAAMEDLEVLSQSKLVKACIAVSKFNKEGLEEKNFSCPIYVEPILLPFEDYRKKSDEAMKKSYQDGKKNILFVGRIAPNKCQEDVIDAFYHYQKYYEKNSRLILIGSYSSTPTYYERLKKHIEDIDVKDVVFPGHITFEQILALYEASDLFLCQSEHEGFCVPLIEAMLFKLPIVAYDAGAISDTLGGGGIVLNNKNHLETAGVMNYVLTHPEIRHEILKEQKKVLEELAPKKIGEDFINIIEEVCKTI